MKPLRARSWVSASAPRRASARASVRPATAYSGVYSDSTAAFLAWSGVYLRGIALLLSGLWMVRTGRRWPGSADLVLLDKGGVDVDQHPLLPLGDRGVGQHGHLHTGTGMVVRIEDPART